MAEEIDGVEDGEIRDPKAVLAALDRAKREAQKFRTELETVREELEETRNNAVEQASNKYKERLVKAEALVALSKLNVKNPDRLAKFVDLSKVTLNEDNELEGLDEQVETLKESLPELFDPKRRVGGQGDQFERDLKKPKSTTELLAEQLMR